MRKTARWGPNEGRGADAVAAPISFPNSVFAASSYRRSSGERWFAVRHQHAVVSRLRRKRVVRFLEPNEFGFQVPYTLLEAAHLGYHAGIGTANVAE